MQGLAQMFQAPVARDRVRVSVGEARSAVCQPGARDPCPRQGSPGLCGSSQSGPGPGAESAECLHCTALQRKQRDCWPGMSAWEAGRGGGEKVVSWALEPVGGLWVRARLGCRQKYPAPLPGYPPQLQPCLSCAAWRPRRPRRTPGPTVSARGNGTPGAVSWAQTLTPGCKGDRASGGSWRGLKAGLDTLPVVQMQSQANRDKGCDLSASFAAALASGLFEAGG